MPSFLKRSYNNFRSFLNREYISTPAIISIGIKPKLKYFIKSVPKDPPELISKLIISNIIPCIIREKAIKEAFSFAKSFIAFFRLD